MMTPLSPAFPPSWQGGLHAKLVEKGTTDVLPAPGVFLSPGIYDRDVADVRSKVSGARSKVFVFMACHDMIAHHLQAETLLHAVSIVCFHDL